LARFDRLEYDQPSEPEGKADGPRPGVEPERERDGDAWLVKADDHRRRGLHENALRYYSRALELDRSLLAGWVGQVQMLVMLGEYPEAELWAKKSLELFKGQGDLMAARAQALSRLGDRRQAMELADASLRQEGNAAFRWMVRGELLLAGKDDMDRHCFDKAVQADRDWLVPLEAALIYLHYDHPSKALLRARQAVEKGPQSPFAWYTQGRCEQDLGFDRQAETSYHRCRELAPGHVDAGRKLSEIANQGWSLSRGLRRLIGRV